MRKLVAMLGALVVGAMSLTACGTETGTQINVYMYDESTFQNAVDDCTKEAGGRYRIVYHKLPRDADGQREQMVRRLAAGDTGLDVLGLDVTWVPEFAEAGWIVEWTGRDKAEASRDVLPGPLKTATWNGKLYAAPKNTNVQLLWYDDRITPTPPKTWDELLKQAAGLKAAGKPYQVLFTGAQYEGLVVFYNTLVASAGGRILSGDGKSVVLDQGALRGLQLLKRITTSGLTDPSLTNSQEDEVRMAMQDGRGAFEINWPFVYASWAEEKPADLKHFKWTTLPEVTPGTPAKSTIGGIDLAVSAYSTHRRESFEAARCLRDQQHQKYAALTSGVPPVNESLYHDTTGLDPGKPVDAKKNPSMETTYPMREDILKSLRNAAIRPLTPAYQSLSTMTSKVLSPPSEIDPPATARELRTQLGAALQSKGVIP